MGCRRVIGVFSTFHVVEFVAPVLCFYREKVGEVTAGNSNLVGLGHEIICVSAG